MPDEYDSKSIHSPAQINAELLAMLGVERGANLRQLCTLAACGSPYVMGGSPKKADTAFAAHIFGIDGEITDAMIEAMIATALRPLESIVPGGGRADGSELPAWSPEWLAEIVCMAASALPSLGFDQALDMPAATLMHLVLAGYRRRGGVTRRPHDVAGALDWLASQESKTESANA